VGPPKPAWQLRTGPTVALGTFLAFVIAFAVVACQVLLVQGQQRLDAVDDRIAEESERYDELRLQVAELESPERIVAAATELGMVPPPEVTYLTPSGAVTLPAGAAAPGIDAANPDRLADHAATRPQLPGGG
jgi:cell division protein FtsL